MTVRLYKLIVQPLLIEDDGDVITDGPETQPQTLTLPQLVAFVDSLPEQIAAMNEALAPPPAQEPSGKGPQRDARGRFARRAEGMHG